MKEWRKDSVIYIIILWYDETQLSGYLKINYVENKQNHLIVSVSAIIVISCSKSVYFAVLHGTSQV